LIIKLEALGAGTDEAADIEADASGGEV